MATEKKKKKKKKVLEEEGRWHHGLRDETKCSVWAIVCLGASLFFVLAIFGKAGLVGQYVYTGLEFLFGEALFLVPVVFFFGAISLFSSFKPNLLTTNLIGGLLVFLSALALVDIIFGNKTGGFVGFGVALPFLKLFDFWASLTFFVVALLTGFLIMFNIPISFGLFKKIMGKKIFKDKDDALEGVEIEESDNYEENIIEEEEPEAEKDDVSVAKGYDVEEEVVDVKNKKNKKYMDNMSKNGVNFKSPPLELLEGDKGKPSAGDIKANANIIKRTFQNFGINIEMNEVCIGPSVTQYSFKPAEGVKVSRIISLNNDLALALAAHPIRIEAPIPGKSLVGIEVPNKTASMVGLKQLLSEPTFQDTDKNLLVALGRNVAGRPVYSSIAKMPHLLIAGATGSGKSVAIHSLMMSLLYCHSPLELQLLLIDPKRVELNIYNDLPYLLSPVITEAKKAIMALKWATKEMERRYEVLLQAGARDITSYHKRNKSGDMPFIVIIIDELADIMATYPRELEASIVRLAQMSRAVGIHLVVSTQRPSVEVITGLIKANITSRMAFQVASQIDSRTILDMSGAEKLLGNGDMLYLSGDAAKPRRIQGSFVSENEVKNVVEFLKGQCEEFCPDEIDLGAGEHKQSSIFDDSSNSFEDEDDDDLYEEARSLVIEAQKASSSYLQRRLRVGYARAARLLDILEERQIVGPQDGSRPREVLVRPMTEGNYEE
ncbi:MAG: DNA translocase FtsK [Candidatus Marinimicrobia bacterium]|nr:DNA translocase FtsK [Candidatus Neomarinimicrobiota bacterium]